MTNSLLVLCNSFIFKQSKRSLCAFFKKGENVESRFWRNHTQRAQKTFKDDQEFFQNFSEFFQSFSQIKLEEKSLSGSKFWNKSLSGIISETENPFQGNNALYTSTCGTQPHEVRLPSREPHGADKGKWSKAQAVGVGNVPGSCSRPHVKRPETACVHIDLFPLTSTVQSSSSARPHDKWLETAWAELKRLYWFFVQLFLKLDQLKA